MQIVKTIKEMGVFIAQAMGRLFSPTDDAYPPTGVQPYAGKRSGKKRRSR